MADRLAQPLAQRSHPFLCPLSIYRGHPSPEYVRFNAELQAFAQQVSFLSNLQTNGKLACEEAYAQIESLWQQLQQSYWQFLDAGLSNSCDHEQL
ncbi:DUF7219 family protein [Trichothermofontia sp.]